MPTNQDLRTFLPPMINFLVNNELVFVKLNSIRTFLIQGVGDEKKGVNTLLFGIFSPIFTGVSR
jgi:hypothetical protein